MLKRSLLTLSVAVVVLITCCCPVIGSDIDVVRERFVRSVTPSEPAMVRRLIEVARDHARQLNEDGSFPNIDYSNRTRARWPVGAHLERLSLMAKAYRIQRDTGQEDALLKVAIDRALNFWLDEDLQNPNWWWNRIGGPKFLGETLLVLGDDANREMIDRVVSILERSVWEKWTGQNLVWGVTIQIMRACLTGDEALMTQAFERMYEEVSIASSRREGIQADFSFHQHGRQLMNGSYGLSFAHDVGAAACYGWKTRFRMPEDKLAIYVDYLLEGEQWMIIGQTFDYSAIGRVITRKGTQAVPRQYLDRPATPSEVPNGLARVVSMLAELDVPRREELQAFSARLDGDEPAPPLLGNRHFWQSDYMVHRTPDFVATIKMLSDRMYNAELVNSEGRRSHHLSDGATFLYNTGDEYFDVFPLWDWRKVPGTTAEQFDLSDDTGIHIRGERPFVGGVSDGRVGLAAMDLRRGDLSAKKMWGCFDDLLVCLGAGITCDTDNSTVTCIDQRLLNGPVSTDTGSNSFDANLVRNVNWIRHGEWRYVFPAGSDIVISAEERTGQWSDINSAIQGEERAGVFAAWLDHGPHARDASYAYVVLRDENASAATRIRIEANTPDIQAVRDEKSGTTMIAFWKAGEITLGKTIAVDRPCLLLVRAQNDRTTTVTVANPTSEPATVNVRLDDASLSIELPDGILAGSSVSATLPDVRH